MSLASNSKSSRSRGKESREREEQLAGGVRLALVMFKENAGRTVQLADDDAFRALMMNEPSPS